MFTRVRFKILNHFCIYFPIGIYFFHVFTLVGCVPRLFHLYFHFELVLDFVFEFAFELTFEILPKIPCVFPTIFRSYESFLVGVFIYLRVWSVFITSLVVCNGCHCE